jgi:2-succinyl-5-enolpyruvyl-6-hydroxy-3-cyclohexene-1-carboxylate synthase
VALLLQQHTIKIHVAVDERSAGYLALGLARSGSGTVMVVCTSGTAAANLYPAVVEANQAGVPLIVLTADRPLELQHAHAPQTIDQTQLYGNHVRRFVELGEGSQVVATLRAFRRLLLDTVQLATTPIPGPVHMNFRARKPLEPAMPKDADDHALRESVEALLNEPCSSAVSVDLAYDAAQLQPLAALCVQNRRGIVLCGFDAHHPPLDAEALAAFARATGFPVWLDPAHPLRWNHPSSLSDHVVHCADLLWQFDDFAIDYHPRLIVQIGPIMTSPAVEQWLSQIGAEHHVVLSRAGWPDPTGRSTYRFLGNPSEVLRTAASRIDELRGGLLGERPWFLDWRSLDARTEQLLEAWCAAQPNEGAGELPLVRAALMACPPGVQLVLGNSLPLREAAVVLPARNREVTAYANRGANGIDGLVSTAVGVAKGRGLPTVALVGDISFIHDLGALWSVRELSTPFVLIVIDNHGGRIFDQLPVSDTISPPNLEAWTTPHQLDLWAAGLLFGIETARPSSVEAVTSAVHEALGRKGPTLVHVNCAANSAQQGMNALRQHLSEKLFA